MSLGEMRGERRVIPAVIGRGGEKGGGGGGRRRRRGGVEGMIIGQIRKKNDGENEENNIDNSNNDQ